MAEAEAEARGTDLLIRISSQVLQKAPLVGLHLLLFRKQANCRFSFPPSSLCLFSKVSVLCRWCLWSKMFDGVGKGEAFFSACLALCSSSWGLGMFYAGSETIAHPGCNVEVFAK